MAIDWNEVATQLFFLVTEGGGRRGYKIQNQTSPFFRFPIVDSYVTLNNTFKSKPIKVVKRVYFYNFVKV